MTEQPGRPERPGSPGPSEEPGQSGLDSPETWADPRDAGESASGTPSGGNAPGMPGNAFGMPSGTPPAAHGTPPGTPPGAPPPAPGLPLAPPGNVPPPSGGAPGSAAGMPPASPWGAPPPPSGGWGRPNWAGGPPPPAPKPGVVPLRPLGFGEVLDGAFTCVQRYPKIMLGLAAAVVTAATVLLFLVMFVGFADVFMAAEDESLEDIGVGRTVTAVVSVLITGLIYWVGTMALTGMITITTSYGVLGRPAPVAEVWRATRPKLWRLLGLSLFLAVAGLVALAVVITGIAFLVAGLAEVAVALAVVVGIVLGVLALVGAFIVGVRLLLAPAVVMLETRPLDPARPDGDQRPVGVFASLGRSWTLVKGRTLRTFGIVFVANLIATVIASILQYGFLFLAAAVAAGVGAIGSSEGVTAALSVTIGSIGIVGSMVVQLAFLAAINALIYVDARMRTEGLDLELAALTAEGRTATVAHPWAVR